MRRVFLSAILFLVLGAAAARAAFRHSGVALLPTDLVAYYSGQPSESPGATAAAAWLLSSMQIAGGLASLPEKTRLWADGLGCLPLLGQYPHVIALLDVRTAPIHDDVYRLDSMRLVVILETDGKQEPVERRIQQMLGLHTNSAFAKLEAIDRNGVNLHRLTDSRIPEWAAFEWAHIGDHYVLGFGRDTVEQVIRVANGDAPSLADDRWQQWAVEACGGDSIKTMWRVDFETLIERLAQTMADRPEEVADALGIRKLQRAMWGVSHSGKAVRVRCAQRADDQDRVVVISDPDAEAPRIRDVIPPGATWHAVVRAPLGRLFEQWGRAYVAAQSRGAQSFLKNAWPRLLQDLKLDQDADLLEPLGGHIVVHDYPLHPWRVPVLVTLMFEIDGDPQRVAAAIDGLLGAWKAAAERSAELHHRQISGPVVDRTEDGIWHLKFGMIVFLGLAVEDDWVILSYSPEAVRANREHLRSRAASQPTTTVFEAK